MPTTVKSKKKAKARPKKAAAKKARAGKPRAKKPARASAAKKAAAKKAGPKKRKAPPSSVSGSAEDLEGRAIGDRARVALEKQRSGKVLSQQDVAAIRRWEERRRSDTFHEVATHLPQHVLVALLGTSKKILLEWERDGMPRNTDRKRTYNLYAVWAWLKVRWLKNPEADAGRLAANARARFQAARATKEERALAAADGLLVPAEAVAREAGELVLRSRNTLLALPARLAPRLEGLSVAEMQGELAGAIEDALLELSEKYGSAKDLPNG